MTISRRKLRELNPSIVQVQLPPDVRKAFGDLAAAVHLSGQVGEGMIETLNDLVGGKNINLEDLVGSLPLLAAQTIRHVQATGDDRVARAWSEIASHLIEEKFILSVQEKSSAIR
jgi:hypothetical protein